MDADVRAMAVAARRFLEQVVRAAEVEAEPAGPTLSEVVDAHLGASCTELPVVREEVPEHQFVDLDLVLSLLAEGEEERRSSGSVAASSAAITGSARSSAVVTAGSASELWIG